MPVGFNSPARNLFLLGSTGAQLVTNFFKTIDRTAGTNGVYLPDEIRYNFSDQKYILAGTASDSQSKDFGWFEKRTEGGVADWEVKVESALSTTDTTLRALEIDNNDNLIVVGKTGTVPWVAKYTNDSGISWQSTTNTADLEYTGIAIDSNNNIYACGNTPTPGSSSQAFIEKFDSSGVPGWGKSAFMLGRDVILTKCAANSRGEVVAVGIIEDDSAFKGYIVKIDTSTGEVLWDRTVRSYNEDATLGYEGVFCEDVYVDGNDQIYVVGRLYKTSEVRSFIIKYTPEGNMIWQKETPAGETIEHYFVKSDTETEQTIVYSQYFGLGGMISKYSKNGDLVFRRVIYSSFNSSTAFGPKGLDADPSNYYLLFVDDPVDLVSGDPKRYTFGKVSSSGNGLGNFTYSEGTGQTIYYQSSTIQDKIGRLSDGSVRQDTSDLLAYPFSANKLLFDDLATQVANKKRQMDGPDSFEYSGSPAIRPADFQELNLLGQNVSGRIWTDTSGKNNNAGASITEPFFGAGSVLFDGNGTHLRTVVASNAFNYGTNNFTIEFWWYRTSNERQALFHGSWGQDWSIGIDFNGSANNQKLGMWASSSGTSWDMLIADAGGNGITTGTPTLNAWNHIAYVRNGSTFTLYLNGTNVGEVTNITAAINSKTTSRQQVIGAWWNSETAMSDVHGYISNFRIVIGSALYTANFTPPKSPLEVVSGTSLLVCKGTNIPISDFSSYIHPITGGGNPTIPNDGPSWNASGWWDLDGTNDYIELPTNPNLTFTGDFTYETWLWTDVQPASNTIWSLPNGQTFQFTTLNSQQELIYYSNEIGNRSFGNLPNNTWRHYIITRSGNTITGYANGIQIWTNTGVNATHNFSGSSIGYRTIAPSGFYWDGRIGEVRIYPRALTAAQVYQNYNATKSKYLNVAPDIAPRIGPGIVYGNDLKLNLDFTSNAVYDTRFSGTYGNPPIARDFSNSSITASPGGAVYNQFGYFDFNGNSINSMGILGVPSFGYDAPISIETWLVIDSTINSSQVIGTVQGSTLASYWLFMFSTNGAYNLSLQAIGTTYGIGTTTLPAIGIWNHLVATYNGGDFSQLSSWKIYVNGVSQTTQITGNANVFGPGSSANQTDIGWVSGGTNANRLDGKVSQYRLYSKALSAAEVSQNFNATRSKYGV